MRWPSGAEHEPCLAEDLSSILSTETRLLTTTCKSSSFKASDTSGLPRPLHLSANTPPIHTIKKKILNYQRCFLLALALESGFLLSGDKVDKITPGPRHHCDD